MALTLLKRRGAPRVSFGELLEASGRVQGALRQEGLAPGDAVLLFTGLDVPLYAAVIAVLALGATVVLVEPWMRPERIEQAVALLRPRVFLSNDLGRLWGLRVPAIRRIPRWMRVASAIKSPRRELNLVQVEERARGVVTFTSGTTGSPKGVVREQGYLVRQQEVFNRSLSSSDYSGPDLCVFANVALANLSVGRGSVIAPSSWAASALRGVDDLPEAPQTLATGPAFLMTLMRAARVSSLKSIHVGGALTDCWIFERAFGHWPGAHVSHVYGGSEVEPVTMGDARRSVSLSRARGLFQTLHLGHEIPELRPLPEPGGLWVAGPHVCPEYLANDEETRRFKRRDAEGTLWHFMGDRVVQDAQGWWYQGRSSQAAEDFELEQRLYAKLGSSKSFLYRRKDGSRWLVGERVNNLGPRLVKEHPELGGVAEARIIRDRRHRARIDRGATLTKGAAWLAS
jgi:acyl-coenzyme A synthetase/AMP-(fatty) acid ligase